MMYYLANLPSGAAGMTTGMLAAPSLPLARGRPLWGIQVYLTPLIPMPWVLLLRGGLPLSSILEAPAAGRHAGGVE